MADLQAEFEQAQKDVETLSQRPSNDDLLGAVCPLQTGHRGRRLGQAAGHDRFQGPRQVRRLGQSSRAWMPSKAKHGYVTKVGALLDADRG